MHWNPLHFIHGGVICQDTPLEHQGSRNAQVGSLFFRDLELCHRHHGAKIYHLAVAVTIQLCLCKSTRYSHRRWPDQLVPHVYTGDADCQLIQESDEWVVGPFSFWQYKALGAASQQSFMLATVRSAPVSCQKACTSSEALTSKASLLDHPHFHLQAALPTCCSAQE